MRKRLYAIRDNVAGEVIGGVHVFPHDAPAVRFFHDLLLDRSTGLGMHAADHDLVVLGSIETETGTIEGHETPQPVLTGAAWLAAQDAASDAEKVRRG